MAMKLPDGVSCAAIVRDGQIEYVWVDQQGNVVEPVDDGEGES